MLDCRVDDGHSQFSGCRRGGGDRDLAVIVVLFTKVGSAMVTPRQPGRRDGQNCTQLKPVPLIVTVCVDGLTREYRVRWSYTGD